MMPALLVRVCAHLHLTGGKREAGEGGGEGARVRRVRGGGE